MEESKTWEDWAVWLSQGKVLPVFQPIVSAETGKIYGYEVLGRFETVDSQGIRSLASLGNFFLSPLGTKPSEIQEMAELKLQVDRCIRAQAIKKFAENSDPETCLFLNISPRSLLEHIQSGSEQPPYTIQKVREWGIRPDRIVIEITEERMVDSLDVLRPILELYRAEGFRIAVDDVGSESSNLDRIGLFHPDIIKVDLQMLRRSVFSRNFKEILLTLSRLGESLGSSLLFEGIETQGELENALKYGSRYLQGYYFSRPMPQFQEPHLYKSILDQNMIDFHQKRTTEIKNILDWESKIESDLSLLPLSLNQKDFVVELDFGLFRDSDVEFFRLYITDSRGIQVSPNYSRSMLGEIIEDRSFLGKNWSWRPYFYEHSYKIANSKNPWVVSSIYHDITDNIMLKTFSRDMKYGLILFIDIVYPWDT